MARVDVGVEGGSVGVAGKGVDMVIKAVFFLWIVLFFGSVG